MRRVTRALTVVAALVAGLAASIGPIAAQDAAYPTRRIKLIIPYGFGGGTDAVATLFKDKLSQKFDVPVIKENRPGSNSVIGTNALVNSPPDGYTLLITTGGIANNPFLYANLPYKTPESFTPISILTSYPFVLAIRSGLPFNNVKELIEYAKANPGKLTAGTPGRGAAPSLRSGFSTRWLACRSSKFLTRGRETRC